MKNLAFRLLFFCDGGYGILEGRCPMSLKTFHIFFICVSAIMLIGFEFWGVWHHLLYGDPSSLVLAVGAGLGSLALIGYGTWFIRKLRAMSYW